MSAKTSEGPTLDELSVGEHGVITRVHGEDIARSRLMEIGFLPGAPVTILRRAPLGDPVEIDVAGTFVAIRGSLARTIEITRTVLGS